MVVFTLKSILRNALIGATVLCATAAGAEDDPVFTVETERLTCVRDHAARYRPEGTRSAFISLADCPNADGNPFLSSVTNSGPDLELMETGLDRFLLLKPAEFECLATLTLPTDVTVVRFYPRECRIEPGE